MLDWLKGGRSEHPLADEKSARAMLADLPADTFQLLDELCGWLAALRDDEALKLPRLVEIVDRIDYAARGPLRRLQQDFLAGDGRMQRFQEFRIRGAATTTWRRLGEAYALVLKRFQAGANGWQAARNSLPLVIARGMRALTMRMKWQLMQYGPADPEIWRGLGAFLAYAEDHDFAQQPVTVYPGSDSTIEREFLKAAMLAVSSTGGLLPRQLDIAERLTAHFAAHYVMQRQPEKGCHFHVDLGASRLPARYVERIESGPGARFFGAGDAAQALEALASRSRASGALPSDLDLGATPDATAVADVAHHLALYWAAQPPARSGERRRSIERIDVVHGYDELLSRLRDDKPPSLDFDDRSESWTVENESEGGYGAVVPQSAADWVRVGALLGVRLSDGAAWGAGVVRRISAQNGNQRYVGLQLLARGASLIGVRRSGSSAAYQPALLLGAGSANGYSHGEVRVLLRAGGFAPGIELEMQAYDRSYWLVPRQLIEGGRDFDLACFRVMPEPA